VFVLLEDLFYYKQLYDKIDAQRVFTRTRWSILLQKMYDEAVDDSQAKSVDPCWQIQRTDQQKAFDEGAKFLLGAMPLPEVHPVDQQLNTVFVTTSHSSSTTTTLTASKQFTSP